MGLVAGIVIGVALCLLVIWAAPHVHAGGGVLVSGWLMVGNPASTPPPPVKPVVAPVAVHRSAVSESGQEIRLRIELAQPQAPPAAKPNVPCPPSDQFNPEVPVPVTGR